MIANSRLDTLHKVSNEGIKDNQVLVVEDLNVKGRVKNRKLSKPIADVSWGNFVSLLQYTCDGYGRKLIKVDRFYSSSKSCNLCGWINQDLNLSIRGWTCQKRHGLDRNHNASIHILKEGLKIYRLGQSITKVESPNKTTSVAQLHEARSPITSLACGQFTVSAFSLPEDWPFT